MYTLDPQSARKADTIGNQIKEIGKYAGTFTQAVDIKTSKGGKGVAFVFKSNSGQKANLAVYTMSADGEKYQGYDALMAIMTCMGLRDIKPKPGTFTKYDFDKKEDVQVEGSIFPDLCKPIGVLLETEDYEKQDGGTGTRMVMKAVFQAATELTASEILDRKTTPEQLPKMVAGLRHRPLKAAKSHAPTPQRQAAHAGGGSGFDDMSDDIPFVTSSMHYDITTSKARRMARNDF